MHMVAQITLIVYHRDHIRLSILFSYTRDLANRFKAAPKVSCRKLLNEIPCFIVADARTLAHWSSIVL